MKKYLTILLILGLILALVGCILPWMKTGVLLPILPILVAYFTGITLLQHLTITRSMHKNLQSFYKTFLWMTGGVLILHLVVMAAYMFTHLEHVRIFVLWFCILYFIYLAFEVIELLIYIKQEQKKGQEKE